MSKRGPIDFGACLCGDCPLLGKEQCPRVDVDAGVMCLQYVADTKSAANLAKKYMEGFTKVNRDWYAIHDFIEWLQEHQKKGA